MSCTLTLLLLGHFVCFEYSTSSEKKLYTSQSCCWFIFIILKTLHSFILCEITCECWPSAAEALEVENWHLNLACLRFFTGDGDFKIIDCNDQTHFTPTKKLYMWVNGIKYDSMYNSYYKSKENKRFSFSNFSKHFYWSTIKNGRPTNYLSKSKI